MTFADLGVPDDLIDALTGHGIGEPFPIQSATIPPALGGQDIAGRAPTGSGKTLAFGIPLVANVQRARPKRPRALVLVPTRELAAQVARDLAWLGARRDVRVATFYGGTRFEPQIKALRAGVDIAVACPGRLIDLIDQGIVRLDGVDLVVVDEADRMADMGFLPDVRQLVDQTDPGRQTLLFSATLDGDVDELVRRYQHDPVTVDVAPETDETQLEHHFWSVPHAKRIATTAAIIDRIGPTIVFTRTRYGSERVALQLGHAGVEAVAIHGNRTQQQRDRALRAFRSGDARALVATDVAARGIHVDDVTCVVHFDLPADPKDYVHRSGRTGRAGATGVVIALAMPDRRKDTDRLLRALDLDVTVEPPDVEALPIGPQAPPKRRRRSEQSNDRRGSSKNRRQDAAARHKPSGKPRKPPPASPDATRPGRAKGAPRQFPDGPARRPEGARRRFPDGPDRRPSRRRDEQSTDAWARDADDGAQHSTRSKPSAKNLTAKRRKPADPRSRTTGPKAKATRNKANPAGAKPAGAKVSGPKAKPTSAKAKPTGPKVKRKKPKVRTAEGRRASTKDKGRPKRKHKGP